MNIVLNCCLTLLVGNLGFRIWSYFVTMETIRSVEKNLERLTKFTSDDRVVIYRTEKLLKTATYFVEKDIKELSKVVKTLEAEMVAKGWELTRRLDDKLTKMEARFDAKREILEQLVQDCRDCCAAVTIETRRQCPSNNKPKKKLSGSKNKKGKCTLSRFECLAAPIHTCAHRDQYAVDNRVEL